MTQQSNAPDSQFYICLQLIFRRARFDVRVRLRRVRRLCSRKRPVQNAQAQSPRHYWRISGSTETEEHVRLFYGCGTHRRRPLGNPVATTPTGPPKHVPDGPQHAGWALVCWWGDKAQEEILLRFPAPQRENPQALYIALKPIVYKSSVMDLEIQHF